ncbi:MAG: hypothetical protein M1834_004483 [Cirrosporium novae-zelandiae]|nr:MAG: hypothetical protein M1834_004483 [Cirrosporium novae-zelandiae]
MKVGKACVQCREGKRKCDRKGTGAPCAQCLRRHLQCSGAVHHTSGSSHSSNPVFILPSTDNVDEVMPDSAALKELIDLYIWYIHDKPHSLFHEPTLRYAISNGTVSKAVLYGILGLSARFSQYEAARSQGPKYAMEAKRLVKADMENICLENIQACVLCGNICFADCNSDAESIYFAIANRMAQLFHLEAEVSSDDAITRETKRRVWWSLYLQECWASAGTGLLRQFHHGGATPAVPMSEPMFLQLHGDADPRPREPGIWAHMITLVRIFADIQDLNYHLVEEESWSGEYVEAPVRNLSSQLEAFKNSLPDTLQNTPENFTYNIQQRLGRTFVALHLSYHHFATLLFFQFLDQERPSTPGVAACAERCKFHAGAFSDLLWASNEHPHAQAVYNIVGHMTVVSSSVLLHTLLFGNEDELPVAKKRLESNFRVLMRLKSYWPSVELMLSRLLNFQSACLQSTSPHTHKIDKWMIRFLLQHVLTLDERLRADSSLAIQTPDSEEPSVEAQRLSHRGRELDKLVRKFY